jgi:hypothetical protein
VFVLLPFYFPASSNCHRTRYPRSIIIIIIMRPIRLDDLKFSLRPSRWTDSYRQACRSITSSEASHVQKKNAAGSSPPLSFRFRTQKVEEQTQNRKTPDEQVPSGTTYHFSGSRRFEATNRSEHTRRQNAKMRHTKTLSTTDGYHRDQAYPCI